MKKVLLVLSALCLMVLSVAGVVAVSAEDVVYGDLDNSGKVNNRDLGLLQRYINGVSGTTIDEALADVDASGKINNRDLGRLQQYLNGYDVTLGPKEPEVPAAELPAVGYDIDGRGRIKVDAISQEGYVVTVTLKNHSSRWMTEETSYVKYVCTDAEGNVLELDERYYGTLYFGMLEAEEVDTYTITLPEGTVKLEFTDWYINYWSQWA